MKDKIFFISISLVFSFLLVTSDAKAAKNQFIENFGSIREVTKNWNILSGANSIFFSDGVMTYSVVGVDDYPYVVTKKVVFPIDKSFTYELRFAFPPITEITGIISAFYYDDAGIPHDIFSTRLAPGKIETRMWNEGTTIPFDSNFHTVKYVWDQDGGTVSSYIDGEFGMQRGLTHPPEYIEIGHQPRVGWWGDMSIDYIRVDWK